MDLIAAYEKELAQIALAQLESNRLEVVLIPSGNSDRKDYEMIRAVQSQNALWYRAFCKERPTAFKPRRAKFQTKIKRQDTLRGLNELLVNRRVSAYAQSLYTFLTRNADLIEAQASWQ